MLSLHKKILDSVGYFRNFLLQLTIVEATMYMNQPGRKEELWNKANNVKTYLLEWIYRAPRGSQKPKRGDYVTVHCTGYGKNRDLTQVFWTTRKEHGAPKDEPFRFQIGKKRVIKAWDIALLRMAVGSRALLFCSPYYAYGAPGIEIKGIMPNSPLLFDIEILKIE